MGPRAAQQKWFSILSLSYPLWPGASIHGWSPRRNQWRAGGIQTADYYLFICNVRGTMKVIGAYLEVS